MQLQPKFRGTQVAKIVLLGLAWWGFPTSAQQISIAGENAVAFGDYYGVAATESASITTFSSSQQARDVVARITKSVGLAPNFQVESANVTNAAAVIRGNQRFVLYNNSFMSTIDVGSDGWSALSILAHEVGHHLQGHTVLGGGSKPDIELEADRFSGFVVGKLGGSLDSASAAMRQVGSDQGSATHPGREARLAAIRAGWEDAVSGAGVPPTAPTPTSTGSRLSAICAFNSGPRVGTRVNYAPLPPVAVGLPCHDGAQSSGIVASDEEPVQSAGTSTLCRFNNGPRSGTSVDYAPQAPIPIGSPCHDGGTSSGVVVAATSQAPAGVAVSTICTFSEGPRAGTKRDYAPMAAIPVGTPCQDGAGSKGYVTAQ